MRLSDGCSVEETPDDERRYRPAEALLGLPGFRVLDVTETDSEVVMAIETTAVRVACRTCGVRAEAQDRMRVDVRDLACFGGRHGWCGRSGGGVAGNRAVTPRPGQSAPSMWAAKQ